MSPLKLKSGFIMVVLLTGAIRSYCQSELPVVFEKGTLAEQVKYLDERTKVYENYRAIREDIYHKFSRNSLDTVNSARRKIKDLNLKTSTLNNRIDSLIISLDASKKSLAEMTRTKESIRVLGLGVNKKTYNAIMWSILGILVFILLFGILLFRHNRHFTLKTKLDLVELKEEFEGYRQKTRLEREQMTRDHFNEIKKLKGR